MERTFVGFGFGAIQAGLFLYEAQKSGNFSRFVISEVVPQVVESVRAHKGQCSVNNAHAEGIENAHLTGLELLNPNDAADRSRLVEAIAEAEELATALPSVKFYTGGGAASVDALLAEGIARSPERARIVYCAENHNDAAHILRSHLQGKISKSALSKTQFLDTVIGKMSGVVTDAGQISEQGLERITLEADRAILVEEFNRILVSRVKLPGFQRGIEVFQEKDNLLPFEEAKLFGHNATHALLAYLGALTGINYIAEAGPELRKLAWKAFMEESGGALIKKHGGVDILFTQMGYRLYVDDLLKRMTNPHLRDTVSRVGRDPERKLGWDDRLVGTIRVALSQGAEPAIYSLGAAAALLFLGLKANDEERIPATLRHLWGDSVKGKAEESAVIDRITAAFKILVRWLKSGQPLTEAEVTADRRG